MSSAGTKLLELIDSMTLENAEAVYHEARELGPRLEESERDCFEALLTKWQAITGKSLSELPLVRK